MLWIWHTYTYGTDKLNLPPCEVAMIKATKIAWKYAETGTGYKAMIIADNKTKKICGE